MQVSNSYSMENIWEVDSSSKKYTKVQNSTLPSGDTVDISEDAKTLYSEMIHKYDKSAAKSPAAEEGNGEQNGQTASGASGSGGDSESDVESIKKQIQSLKSQIAALTSQMGSGGDAASMSKINSLQAQIAALEAQLNEMAEA